jgi:hypothetical protein
MSMCHDIIVGGFKILDFIFQLTNDTL